MIFSFMQGVGEKNNKEIGEQLSKRDVLRAEGKYAEADLVRKNLVEQGYLVVDHKNGTATVKRLGQDNPTPLNPLIALFGSGEISNTGRQIHDAILKRINKDKIKIAIVTTPAGFQPNVSAVYQDIANFFIEKLQNYHPEVQLVYANNQEMANDNKIIAPILSADYIVTGPGSPTYAVKHLRRTKLLNAIEDRVKKGASLALASAAVIAFSKHCLPVYEIYKAGADLYWEKGLNFFKNFGGEHTYVPHFNNNEGGVKLDTRFCYMGDERFNRLLKIIPEKEKITGIDEHTALVININEKKQYSQGKGGIHQIF